MKINADYKKRASVHTSQMSWTPSPAPGVDRKMLDRIGGEVARATTIVRYAPGSKFSPHIHEGGEEFLVLDGVFQDEHGDYPIGTYVRNPPGSRHAPSSAEGCTIFVKLRQFKPNDSANVIVDTNSVRFQSFAQTPEISASLIFVNDYELVRIERWEPGAHILYNPKGGLEILCLEGGFTEGGEDFALQSWLRLPVNSPLHAVAGPEGCLVWIKEEHLWTLDGNEMGLL